MAGFSNFPLPCPNWHCGVMNKSDIDESPSSITSPQPSPLLTHAQPANNVTANEQSIMKPDSQSTIRLNVRASKERFSKQDIECILTWLEHPPNFASIFGSSSAGKPGVEQPPKSSSTQGYATLAQVVSEQNKGRLKLNAKAMRERFGRFRRTYENVREMSKSKDFGVTDEDRKNGLYTVADKLESMCVCYARMDALFGHRSNITPSANDTPTIQEQSRGQEQGQEQEQEQEYRRGSAVPQRRRRLLKEDEGDEDNQNEGCEDHEGLAAAKKLEGRGSDGHLDSDDDETNEPATSTQSAIQQQQQQHQWQKRHRKDMEPQLSNKRSRQLEHHQNSPSLRSSSPELPRRSVSSSNGLVARKTAEVHEEIEKRKLDLEAKRLELEEAREMKRLELEEKKLEHETLRQRSELDSKVKLQRMLLMQAGIEKGWSIDRIQALLEMVNITPEQK